jgi:hypothetical protein
MNATTLQELEICMSRNVKVYFRILKALLYSIVDKMESGDRSIGDEAVALWAFELQVSWFFGFSNYLYKLFGEGAPLLKEKRERAIPATP